MSGKRYAITYAEDTARAVARHVSRGFFGVREFPQAFARMVLTREFGVFVGIPVVLLVAARFVPGAAETALTLLAVAWLIAGLLRIARYGPSSGIGCYAVEEGGRGRLLGGLRMRFERRSRRIWIAGLLVDPACRGQGLGTALMLAAFRVAQAQARHGPVTVAVFAPTHPASKAIVDKYLGGRQTVEVAEPPSEALTRVIAGLEQALQKSPAAFDWELPLAERKLF